MSLFVLLLKRVHSLAVILDREKVKRLKNTRCQEEPMVSDDKVWAVKYIVPS